MHVIFHMDNNQVCLPPKLTSFRLQLGSANNVDHFHSFISMTDDKQHIWVLSDDRAGNRSQVRGVAACLGLPVKIKELAYGPLAVVPNVS